MQQYFGRDGFEVVVVVPIGHVAPDCPKAEKKRKPLTDIMDVI